MLHLRSLSPTIRISNVCGPIFDGIWAGKLFAQRFSIHHTTHHMYIEFPIQW